MTWWCEFDRETSRCVVSWEKRTAGRGCEGLPLDGRPGLHPEFSGWRVTPGEFNGLCRGEAWGEPSARLRANLCSITSQLHDCRQLTSIL